MKSIISSIVILSAVVGGLAQPHKNHKGNKGADKGANGTASAGAGAAGAQGGGSVVSAASNPPTGASGPAMITIKQSSPDAAADWAKDTAVVSNFLNIAPTLKGQAFINQAKIALNAELNELSHKANLDADPNVTSQASIKAANASLVTRGHFQNVVDLLRVMSVTGDSVGASDADAINLNRCKNVLPAIDAYLAAAGTDFKSTRPFNCNVNSRIATGAPGSKAPFGGQNPDAANAQDTIPTSG